jgi:hypothetical protein
MESGIVREPLYQVWAIERKTNQLVPIRYFPRIRQQVAEEYASLVNKMVKEGKESNYADARALLHIEIPQPDQTLET